MSLTKKKLTLKLKTSYIYAAMMDVKMELIENPAERA